MVSGHCSCPECGTTLRIRDRSFVGRQVECPDCQTKLVISLDGDRKLIAERVREAAPTKAPAARLVEPAMKATAAVGGRLQEFARSPLVIVWALGIGITAFVAIMMLRPAVRFQTAPDKQPDSVAAQPGPNLPTDASVVNPGRQTPGPADQSSQGDGPLDPVASRPAESNSTVDATVPTAVATTASAADVATFHEHELSVDVPSALNVANAPSRRPQLTVVRPAPAKVQVEELFKQPIQGYSTAKPLSRRVLLAEIEEMLGARIHYDRDELGANNLDQTMSITLEATTVGGILKAVLDAAGWDYAVENDGIRLRPRRVAEKGPS